MMEPLSGSSSTARPKRAVAKPNLSNYASTRDDGATIIDAGHRLREAGHRIEPWTLSCCFLDGLPRSFSTFKDEQYAKLEEIWINTLIIQYNHFWFSIANHGGIEVLLRLLLLEEPSTPQDTKEPAGLDDRREYNQREGEKRSRQSSPLPNATDSEVSSPSMGGFLGSFSNNGGDDASKARKLFENLTENACNSSDGVKETEGVSQFEPGTWTTSKIGSGSQKFPSFFGVGFEHIATNVDGNSSRERFFESDSKHATSSEDKSQKTENFFNFGNVEDSGDNIWERENVFGNFYGNVSNNGVQGQKAGRHFRSYPFHGAHPVSKRAEKPIRVPCRKSPKSLLSPNLTLLAAVCRQFSIKNLARLSQVSKHIKTVVEPVL